MKKLLAPAAIVLAIGSGSVPAKGDVDNFEYREFYNHLRVHIHHQSANQESTPGFRVIGGKAGAPSGYTLKTGTVCLCDGGSGSAISDKLTVSVPTTGAFAGRAVVDFFSDSPTSLGSCPSTINAVCTLGVVNETRCGLVSGLHHCDVSHFFGLPGRPEGYVIIESGAGE
jgi:hypothetical protein